ncbi:C19orf24 [Branchiostoma lanceolatum]|uniref:C19orf24 protein n=1 Tax=Branchiostoma lanceolatum TaxID=7740 RepID=A0A8J9ZGZ1_BRALA|nr:C19orf24 [Branchiostoma lanceolatum]
MNVRVFLLLALSVAHFGVICGVADERTVRHGDGHDISRRQVAQNTDDTSSSTPPNKPVEGSSTNSAVQTVLKTTNHSNSSYPTVAVPKGSLWPYSSEVVKRMLYVLIGVTALVVLYFIVRAVRLRRRRSKSKKYGVLTTSADMEMAPLDQDDDDEDMTMFDIKNTMSATPSESR